MLRLVRGNSFVHLQRAPLWFLEAVERHLSIRLELGHPSTDVRFGRIWWHHGEPWGSLLHGERLAVGLLGHVWHLAEHYQVPFEYEDARGPAPAPQHPGMWARGLPVPRPYQERVHATALQHAVGVVDSLPRSGKTYMLARLIDALGLPTLYLAPAVAIVSQTYKVLAGYFGEELVARVDGTPAGKQYDLSKMIVVATVPSALKLPREFLQSRRVLALDECHHAAAESYHELGALCEHAYYRYSFTGTYWRTADDRLAMEAVASRVLTSVALDELVPHYLARPAVHYVQHRARPFRHSNWKAAYAIGIVHSEERNACIAAVAADYARQGISTIVVTHQRIHADKLGQLVTAHGIATEVAKGGEGLLTSRTIERFRAGDFPVLVGTTVLGEGVDVPIAGALIYATGLGGSVRMMQSYFRPLTASAGKECGCIVDFDDRHHPTLARHARARRRLAEQELGGFVVPTIP